MAGAGTIEGGLVAGVAREDEGLAEPPLDDSGVELVVGLFVGGAAGDGVGGEVGRDLQGQGQGMRPGATQA